MGRADDAYEYVTAAIILVIGLYLVADIVWSLIATNPLFYDTMIGGGILTAIVEGARSILKMR